MGEGNFLKKVFLPPHPQPSKTFKQGLYLLVYIVRSRVERTMSFFIIPFQSFLAKPFLKRNRGKPPARVFPTFSAGTEFPFPALIER